MFGYTPAEKFTNVNSSYKYFSAIQNFASGDFSTIDAIFIILSHIEIENVNKYSITFNNLVSYMNLGSQMIARCS